MVEHHLDELIESFRDPDDPEVGIPNFVEKEFRAYLTRGRPEFGLIKLRCEKCQHEHALPFSCKGRAICPSCAIRRREDTAAHLVEHVLPDVSLRQWVLSPPFELRGLLAARGQALSRMARIFVDEIFKQMKSGATSQGLKDTRCGAVTFLQRFTKVTGPNGILSFSGDLQFSSEERMKGVVNPQESGSACIVDLLCLRGSTT